MKIITLNDAINYNGVPMFMKFMKIVKADDWPLVVYSSI